MDFHVIGRLRFSISKTEFIGNINGAPFIISLEGTAIRKQSRIKESGSQQMTMRPWQKRAYHPSKSLSKKLQIKLYNTLVRPSELYASECLLMNRKDPLRKLELAERKVLKRKLGSIMEELYEHQEDMITSMRKRRLLLGALDPYEPMQTHQQDHHKDRQREGCKKQLDNHSLIMEQLTFLLETIRD